MELTVGLAEAADAPRLAALSNAAADDLTARFGRGAWSMQLTEAALERALDAPAQTTRVLAIRRAGAIVGALRLVTKKPWAIDRSYFTPVRRPLYLVGMVVAPAQQRQGIGRRLIEAARDATRAWPADALCLDAYAHPAAGAGPFYARCGFREVGRATYRGVPLIYFEWLP